MCIGGVLYVSTSTALLPAWVHGEYRWCESIVQLQIPKWEKEGHNRTHKRPTAHTIVYSHLGWQGPMQKGSTSSSAGPPTSPPGAHRAAAWSGRSPDCSRRSPPHHVPDSSWSPWPTGPRCRNGVSVLARCRHGRSPWHHPLPGWRMRETLRIPSGKEFQDLDHFCAKAAWIIVQQRFAFSFSFSLSLMSNCISTSKYSPMQHV